MMKTRGKIFISTTCALLVLLLVLGYCYVCFTDHFVLYARHIPKERKPLEIDFVFDKPDEIVYYSNPVFGKKLTDEQRDAVWEAFRQTILQSEEIEHHTLKTWNPKTFLKYCLNVNCLEFRYEQRRKSNATKAFEGEALDSLIHQEQYDGILIALNEADLSYGGALFYLNLHRNGSIGFSMDMTDSTQCRIFGDKIREVLSN